MASKGINHQNTSIPNLDITDTTWNISSYSSAAKSILNQLKSLVNNYTVSQHSSFISQCTTLKTSALNLQRDNEAISVGMEVSIAINSFNYWKDNISLWKNYLVYSPNRGLYEKVAACDVNLKHAGALILVGLLLVHGPELVEV